MGTYFVVRPILHHLFPVQHEKNGHCRSLIGFHHHEILPKHMGSSDGQLNPLKQCPAVNLFFSGILFHSYAKVPNTFTYNKI